MKYVMILGMCFLLTAAASCQRGEREIIVVPKGYTGYIVIIYNQKQGTATKYHDKRRVYEIPSSGILKTQFSANYGWREFPEFYCEKIAPENKIPFETEFKNVPQDSIVAFGGVSGGANKDHKGEDVVRYLEYYVGNKEQIEAAVAAAEKLDVLELSE